MKGKQLMTFKVPEKYRLKEGRMASDESFGNNGVFQIPVNDSYLLNVIASDGNGWEHVSVSLPNRTPTWDEMCLIKNEFWGDEDLVIQFHPQKSQYVDCHPHCLHMWRVCDSNNYVALPDPLMVGFR
jgi:hypothetical protein